MNLICNKCGKRETAECCVVGEICYLGCGGLFVEHKTTVEHAQECSIRQDRGVSTQDLIKIKCDECRDLLLEKNREYGDSALHPLGIFSKLEAIEAIKVRIDDKLARIQFSGQKNIKEDTVLDLIGYLILMRVCEAVNSDDAEG